MSEFTSIPAVFAFTAVLAAYVFGGTALAWLRRRRTECTIRAIQRDIAKYDDFHPALEGATQGE